MEGYTLYILFIISFFQDCPEDPSIKSLFFFLEKSNGSPLCEHTVVDPVAFLYVSS